MKGLKMITIASYAHAVMINFFDNTLIALLISIAAYFISEPLGNIVYPFVCGYLLWAMYTTWGKIIDPNNQHLNCWHNGGK